MWGLAGAVGIGVSVKALPSARDWPFGCKSCLDFSSSARPVEDCLGGLSDSLGAEVGCDGRTTSGGGDGCALFVALVEFVVLVNMTRRARSEN